MLNNIHILEKIHISTKIDPDNYLLLPIYIKVSLEYLDIYVNMLLT